MKDVNEYRDGSAERIFSTMHAKLEEKAICGGIPASEWQRIYDVYGNRFDLWNGKEGE